MKLITCVIRPERLPSREGSAVSGRRHRHHAEPRQRSRRRAGSTGALPRRRRGAGVPGQGQDRDGLLRAVRAARRSTRSSRARARAKSATARSSSRRSSASSASARASRTTPRSRRSLPTKCAARRSTPHTSDRPSSPSTASCTRGSQRSRTLTHIARRTLGTTPIRSVSACCSLSRLVHRSRPRSMVAAVSDTSKAARPRAIRAKAAEAAQPSELLPGHPGQRLRSRSDTSDNLNQPQDQTIGLRYFDNRANTFSAGPRRARGAEGGGEDRRRRFPDRPHGGHVLRP